MRLQDTETVAEISLTHFKRPEIYAMEAMNLPTFVLYTV